MTEPAVTYGILAWLICWDIDLIITIATRPMMLDPALKFLVVTACIAAIIWRLVRARWLL